MGWGSLPLLWGGGGVKISLAQCSLYVRVEAKSPWHDVIYVRTVVSRVHTYVMFLSRRLALLDMTYAQRRDVCTHNVCREACSPDKITHSFIRQVARGEAQHTKTSFRPAWWIVSWSQASFHCRFGPPWITTKCWLSYCTMKKII